jgi:hypothetical protein
VHSSGLDVTLSHSHLLVDGDNDVRQYSRCAADCTKDGGVVLRKDGEAIVRSSGKCGVGVQALLGGISAG